MSENSRPQTPSFGGSGWVMLFRGSPAPACRARVRAPSAPQERDDLRVVSFFIVYGRELAAQRPPLGGPGWVMLFRGSPAPACRARVRTPYIPHERDDLKVVSFFYYDYPQKHPLVWGQRRAFSGQKARLYAEATPGVFLRVIIITG